MKNKNKNFPQQTHFVGVLVPEDITLTLEDCRRYMNERYGCMSGYGTPIHITLVSPFHLPEEFSTADLAAAISSDVLSQSENLKFDAHIDNFTPLVIGLFMQKFFAVKNGLCCVIRFLLQF